MAGFIIFRKFSHEEARENIDAIEKWFTANPRRRICLTDLFKVRRGHVREDILKHTINAESFAASAGPPEAPQ